MKFVTPSFLILHTLLPLGFTLETGSNATQLQTLQQLLPACSVSFVVVSKHMGQCWLMIYLRKGRMSLHPCAGARLLATGRILRLYEYRA